MSRYLVIPLLVLASVGPALCAAKPAKAPPKPPTAEFARPPRLSIDISGRYQQPKLSADGTKQELTKWVLRAEIKNTDSSSWCIASTTALFHSTGKKAFLPVLTVTNRPTTVAAAEAVDLLWPWESFLVQTATKEPGGRGFSNISLWDLVLNADLGAGEEDFGGDETPPWLADILQDKKPARAETDFSFACTLAVDGKPSAWADATVGPGQSWVADWESISLATPDELKNMGIADSVSHDLTLVGPVIYKPNDIKAGAFLVSARLTGPLPSSPAKFTGAEVVQLTPKYIEEQINNGPTDAWKAFFVSLLWDQPRVMDNPDGLLLRTLKAYDKSGTLAAATAGVCLERRRATSAVDALVSIASDSKANEKMRARIVKGLYMLDTTAIRDCLAGIARSAAEPYLVRLLALNSLAECPQCDWAVIEKFKEDKTLQGTASSLIRQHEKNVQAK